MENYDKQGEGRLKDAGRTTKKHRGDWSPWSPVWMGKDLWLCFVRKRSQFSTYLQKDWSSHSSFSCTLTHCSTRTRGTDNNNGGRPAAVLATWRRRVGFDSPQLDKHRLVGEGIQNKQCVVICRGRQAHGHALGDVAFTTGFYVTARIKVANEL